MLDLGTLQIDPDRPYQVHDLVSDQRYQWRGAAQLRDARPAAHAGARVSGCGVTCAANETSTTFI